jgi:HK97 family phage major capsid protein
MPKITEQDEIKIGARNSAQDAARIQAAHDTLCDLGAKCKDPSYVELDAEKSVVVFGGEVKAIGDGKLGGYLVRFTTARDPDLTGDFFTAGTDYGSHKTTPVLYQHGLDVKMGGRILGEGTLTLDEVGVWLEAQLNLRDEYEKAIYDMAKAGKLGWSSGTASHLVEREPHGKAWHITRWPLGLDASLTPTPAEPRNSAVPMKSIIGNPPQEAFGPLGETVNPIVSTPKNSEGKMEINDELKSLMAETAKAAVEEYKRAEPATVTAGANVVITKDEAEQPFKSGGEFLKAVHSAAIDARGEDKRLRPLKATGMSEGIGADGGYLVPPAFAAGIQGAMLETGSIMSRVNMVNVSGNSMAWNIVDETSRASSRFGGVVGYWMGEGSTKTASAPKFKQLELKLKKVAALCYATDELLADVSALGSWLTTNVPAELRFQVEEAFIAGDGVGKPFGIVGAPGTVSQTRVDANKIQVADIVGMYALRLGNGPFAWFINRSTMPQLMQLAGTYQYMWLPPGALSSTPYGQLLGYPVIETEHCSALGTVGDIILADMSMYTAIQKGGVEAASSIHVKFTTDETAFRFVYRVDGAPMLSSSITPAKGSALSPFVTLSTSS